MKELILATSNSGKIVELQDLLAPIHCIPQGQFNITSAEETGLSFVENALLKARHASRLSNKPALADDSGLVVAALNGEPGIYSSRFAGEQATDEQNIQLLLQKMEHITHREAFFYCAIVVVRHADDPTPLFATGAFHGAISTEPSGKQGFGYDPVFYVSEYQCTAAEIPAKIKNSISHRAKAFSQLRHLITDL